MSPRPNDPPRVRTAEDNAWTRNRGCADLLLIALPLLVALLLITLRGC